MKNTSPTRFFLLVFDYMLMLSLVLFVFSAFWERRFFIVGEENLLYLLLFFLIAGIFLERTFKNSSVYKMSKPKYIIFQMFSFFFFWLFSFFALDSFILTGWKRAIVAFFIAGLIFALNCYFIENVQIDKKSSA